MPPQKSALKRSKATTYKKGGAPTMRELFVHLHSRNAEGKSPVLEKYKASQVEAASEAYENDDGNVSLQPTTEETGAETESFDITSLKFTTQKAEEVIEPLYNSHALHEGVMGNMQTLQGQRPTSLPQYQEGGSLMQIPHSQGRRFTSTCILTYHEIFKQRQALIV